MHRSLWMLRTKVSQSAGRVGDYSNVWVWLEGIPRIMASGKPLPKDLFRGEQKHGMSRSRNKEIDIVPFKANSYSVFNLNINFFGVIPDHFRS